MKRSFTLVELLIVLLIIGLIASIAIPQYEKMVERSKWSQAFIKMIALRKAENAYYAEVGKWVVHREPNNFPTEYDNEMRSLSLEPSDFRGDKYFRYWWGSGGFITPDGKRHHAFPNPEQYSDSGVAVAARIDANGEYTLDSLLLFNDDGSIWRAQLKPTIKTGSGEIAYYKERIQ